MMIFGHLKSRAIRRTLSAGLVCRSLLSNGSIDRAHGVRVEAELVRTADDLARFEAALDHERPEFARRIVRLVVIDLFARRDSETKGRCLEHEFAAPRRHVQEAGATMPEHPPHALERLFVIPEVL